MEVAKRGKFVGNSWRLVVDKGWVGKPVHGWPFLEFVITVYQLKLGLDRMVGGNVERCRANNCFH